MAVEVFQVICVDCDGRMVFAEPGASRRYFILGDGKLVAQR